MDECGKFCFPQFFIGICIKKKEVNSDEVWNRFRKNMNIICKRQEEVNEVKKEGEIEVGTEQEERIRVKKVVTEKWGVVDVVGILTV